MKWLQVAAIIVECDVQECTSEGIEVGGDSGVSTKGENTLIDVEELKRAYGEAFQEVKHGGVIAIIPRGHKYIQVLDKLH